MSLGVVSCRNCGALNSPVGQVRASLRLAASSPCPCCYQGLRRDREISFCSVECLLSWVRATDGVSDEAGAIRAQVEADRRRAAPGPAPA